MKKVLIAYASAGAGHFKAAEAIRDYLKDQRPDLEPDLIDILDKTNPLFKLTYTRGYAFLINHLVVIWQWIFWVTSLRRLRLLARRLVSFGDTIHVARFARFLVATQPDFIVSTHFLSSEIAAALKTKGKIRSMIITVITDFGVHPFWVSQGADLYIAASDYTKEQLILAGAEGLRVRSSGIPVAQKFLKAFDRQVLCAKLGLDGHKFTVLIVTGSFGIGPIEEITGLLYPFAQVIVVCARNKRLYQRLNELGYPGCLVLGFVDNIEELMAVSQVIVTKPGGMSIAESLVMGLVPVFISPIPGQETENIRAMQDFGIGFYPREYSGIKDIIIDLKEHPEKLKAMQEKISKISKPAAAAGISDAIR